METLFNEDSGRFPVLIDFETEDAERVIVVSPQPDEDVQRVGAEIDAQLERVGGAK